MNELSVKVEQTIGIVSWNFEELKANLQNQLAEYKSMVYTDENIGTAKTDVAMLRKLATSVEDRRKEIKNKCLEPYTYIEAQAKELVSLINEPINVINAQVADYERRRKEYVKAEIKAYWEEKSVVLPSNITERAYSKIYDSRWENVSSTRKAYRTGIDDGINGIVKDLETIKSFESEFEDEMLKVYSQNLVLSEAITKMNSLQTMKKMVEERQRREEENRRIEAERRAAAAEERAKIIAESKPEPVIDESKPVVEHVPVQEQQFINPTDTFDPFSDLVLSTMNLSIKGTTEQLNKIKAYITYAGATFVEV